MATRWQPPPGRHKVNAGTSLVKAFKLRKEGGAPPPPKRNGIPDRDFYSLKYNFKPTSIDSSKPGKLEIRDRSATTDAASVRVDFPSAQPGEYHSFSGQENSTTDFTCVLIFDEDTGTFTLEKLESCMNLDTHERKYSTERSSASTPSTSSSRDNIRSSFSQVMAPKVEKEEDDKLPIMAAVRQPPPPAPPPMTSKPKVQVASSASVLPSASVAAPSAAKPKKAPQLKGKDKGKRPEKRPPPTPSPAINTANVEKSEFSRPPSPRPAKRARPNPPPPPPPAPVSPPAFSLELPGSSSSYAHPLPAPVSAIPPPVPQATGSHHVDLSMDTADDSDDPEDWEDVAPVEPTADEETFDIFGETMHEEGTEAAGMGEMELDLAAFENEMNEHLQESEPEHEPDGEMEEIDFLQDAFDPPEGDEPQGEVYQSLRQQAGDDDEEDYSSSDESDED